MSFSEIESKLINDIKSIDSPFEYAFTAVFSKRKRKISNKTNRIKNLGSSSSSDSTQNIESNNDSNSKDLDFSRKNIQHYWFQKEGKQHYSAVPQHLCSDVLHFFLTFILCFM